MHINDIQNLIRSANNAPVAETKAGLAAIAAALYPAEAKPLLTIRDMHAAKAAEKKRQEAFAALGSQVYGAKSK
jgi:hypothetical protein